MVKQMSSIWGKNIKISIFGESHSKAVGVTIEGLIPGVEIDLDAVKHQLFRRSSWNEELSTLRKEIDDFEIISGFFNNKTTGTPLCAIFNNKNINSEVYKENSYKPRPGTADYSVGIRYNYCNDFRGGGHNSARLTVGLVFAGNICYQVLKCRFKDVIIGAHVYKLYNKTSKPFNKCNINRRLLHKLSMEYFPVIDDKYKQEYIKIIHQFKKSGNSIGGEIEVAITGLPAGIGSPIFENFESKVSSLLFAIPAVKSVDFGLGITEMDGAMANDEFFYDEDLKVTPKTNNHCGILGGVTSGAPIIFKVGFKPIASIFKPQNTVNLRTKKNTTITIKGRHDVSPVIRAAPIVEGVAAIAILDMLMDLH